MIEFHSLANTSFDHLFLTFQEAFKDYEIQLDKEQLRVMLLRRGFDPELSFGASEDGRLVSFTCNGIGFFKGKRTAYDTGTGTMSNYRGQGLATRVFEYSLPFLQKAGIKNYLLEVLQHNSKAISVYEKLGFQVTREFNYFTQELGKLNLDGAQVDKAYQTRELALDREDSVKDFWDFEPSWQNNFASINRHAGDFQTLGAFHNSTLVAYCILERNSGDLTQIAVDKSHRRKGLASRLLSEILRDLSYPELKVINTEVACTSMTKFLESRSIKLRGRQYEMMKSL